MIIVIVLWKLQNNCVQTLFSSPTPGENLWCQSDKVTENTTSRWFCRMFWHPRIYVRFYYVVHVLITNCSTSLSMLTCTSFYFECCQTLCEQIFFFPSRYCSNKINSNGTIFRCNLFFSPCRRDPKVSELTIFNQTCVIHHSRTARTDDTRVFI